MLCILFISGGSRETRNFERLCKVWPSYPKGPPLVLTLSFPFCNLFIRHWWSVEEFISDVLVTKCVFTKLLTWDSTEVRK